MNIERIRSREERFQFEKRSPATDLIDDRMDGLKFDQVVRLEEKFDEFQVSYVFNGSGSMSLLPLADKDF